MASKKQDTRKRSAPSRGKSSFGFADLSPVLTYVVLPVVAVVTIYFIVKNLLTGGGQAFLDLYKVQLNAYIKKMEGYSKQNNGVLNEAQRLSAKTEADAMDATQANASQAFNDPWKVVGLVATVAVAVLSAVYVANHLPQIIQKWKPIFENPTTKPRSGKGISKMMDCVLVDQLAAQGFMTNATTFFTQIQNMWNTIDVPQMQAQMMFLQSQINAGVLTGFELMMAQATIQSYTFEIVMMPSVFALPLLEYRGR